MIKNIYDYDISGLKLPTSCPCCGGDLEVQENGMVKCINPNCRQKLSHKVFSFLISMGIKGAGKSFVADAVQDITDLPDFISRIIKSDEDAVKWAGGINGSKVATRVRKNLKRSITISKFLACFDIEGIGEGQIDKVLKAIPEADLAFFLHPGSASQFICRGVGTEIAEKMYKGLLECSAEIEACLPYFNVAANAPEEKPTEGKLLGLSFCFTGSMTYKRSDLEKMVTENGGTISAVNKNLSYLVQQDPNSTSSKSEKARKLGTKIISPEEFLNMLK